MPRFEGTSPEAVDLVEKMMVFDPAKRITIDDAIKHPVFKSKRR
jgi:serine/threonine protein kinase